MVDLTDTSKISTMEGHDAPVLCVRFDPLVKYLVSSIVHLHVQLYMCMYMYIIDNNDYYYTCNKVISIIMTFTCTCMLGFVKL